MTTFWEFSIVIYMAMLMCLVNAAAASETCYWQYIHNNTGAAHVTYMK